MIIIQNIIKTYEGDFEMDGRKYEVFRAAVEYGSFTKAAQMLGYTQSAVTQMVNALEKEFGFLLLMRKRTGVSLTEEGKHMYPFICEALQWEEKIRQEAARIRGVEEGEVRIGVFTSVAVHWLPKLLKTFRKDYPGVRIQLAEGGSAELAEWLKENQVDMIFCSRAAGVGRDWIPLAKDPIVAVLPVWHKDAGRESFDVSWFEREEMVVSPKEFDSDVAKVYKSIGNKLNVEFVSRDDYTIISMVANGLGVSVLPDLVLKGFEDKVTGVPLNPEYYRELGIAVRNLDTASLAVKRVVEYAKRILRQ